MLAALKNRLRTNREQKRKITEEARIIVESAHEEAAFTLERRKELDRQGLQNKPLIVLKSEEHDHCAHALDHMFYLEEILKAGERIVVGQELSHNTLANAFFYATGHQIDRSLISEIRKRDQNGSLSLKAGLTYERKNEAFYSNTILSRYLWRRNSRINVRHTDIAKINTGDVAILDLQDSFMKNVKDITMTLNLPVMSDINAHSSMGKILRDYHSTSMFSEFSLAHQARIAVYICGNSHISRIPSEPYDPYTLPGLYKNLELPVLSIFPLGQQTRIGWSLETCDSVPAAVFAHDSLPADSILVRSKLPKRTAAYHSFENTAIANYPAEFQDLLSEAHWTNAILAHTSLRREQMSLHDFNREVKKANKELSKCYERWQKEFSIA